MEDEVKLAWSGRSHSYCSCWFKPKLTVSLITIIRIILIFSYKNIMRLFKQENTLSFYFWYSMTHTLFSWPLRWELIQHRCLNRKSKTCSVSSSCGEWGLNARPASPENNLRSGRMIPMSILVSEGNLPLLMVLAPSFPIFVPPEQPNLYLATAFEVWAVRPWSTFSSNSRQSHYSLTMTTVDYPDPA